MTNEEAVRILEDITWNSNGRYKVTDMLDTRNLSIQALEENTKLKAELEQLQSANAKLCEEIAELKRFKQYFDELYETGLEVANWHLNGDLEPLDNFMDFANDYMKEKESNQNETNRI